MVGPSYIWDARFLKVKFMRWLYEDVGVLDFRYLYVINVVEYVIKGGHYYDNSVLF